MFCEFFPANLSRASELLPWHSLNAGVTFVSHLTSRCSPLDNKDKTPKCRHVKIHFDFFFIPIFLEDGRRRGVGNRVLLAPPVGSHFEKLEIVTRLDVSVIY